VRLGMHAHAPAACLALHNYPAVRDSCYVLLRCFGRQACTRWTCERRGGALRRSAGCSHARRSPRSRRSKGTARSPVASEKENARRAPRSASAIARCLCGTERASQVAAAAARSIEEGRAPLGPAVRSSGHNRYCRYSRGC
jgi:hypothetical protein